MINLSIARVPMNWLMVLVIVTLGAFALHWLMALIHGLPGGDFRPHQTNIR